MKIVLPEDIFPQIVLVLMELLIKMENVSVVNTHALNVKVLLLLVPNVLELIELKIRP